MTSLLLTLPGLVGSGHCKHEGGQYMFVPHNIGQLAYTLSGGQGTMMKGARMWRRG